jgi:ABC-type dipeptide/oligopeptide/nickel transport system ATPase component
MVYQDPFTYLNPVMQVGSQVAEVLTAHRGLSRRAARDAIVELLQRLDLPSPAALMEAYPHQLSGGQRQRIVIATAVALAPSLLIADEPTTALDVTVQAQILQLLASLAQEQHISLLLISHDLGVVRAVCDQVAVMYRGRIVETGAAETVLSRPRDPYTKQLVTASARLGGIAVTSGARMQDPA